MNFNEQIIKLLEEIYAVDNSVGIADVISIALAVVTLIMTIIIPIRIMKNQIYVDLISAYRSYDFASAVQSVVSFYKDECSENADNIAVQYAEHFKKDMVCSKPADEILHYQRRLLTTFYWQLNDYASKDIFSRYKVLKEFSKGEAYIIKILVYMNKAVDENPEIYRDISRIRYEFNSYTKGINKYLQELYLLLTNAGRWIK